MARVTGLGLRVDLPAGWDARIYRRQAAGAATTHTILHASTFPLPLERGDFGSGAVEVMGPDDVLVMLLEQHPDSAGTPLYAEQGVPGPLTGDDFSRDGLQRALPGQAGAQRFFSVNGRAWTLYVVLGSYAARDRLVGIVNDVLATIDVAGIGG